MSPRSTAVLAVVAAALGAFIWFYEIEGEAGRNLAEQAEKQLFSDLEAGAIEWIELETTDGVRARIERRSARWRLVSPLDFPADAVALDAMAGALADLAQEQAIDPGQPLSVYGLGEGARQVEFGTESGSDAVRIGNKTPLGPNTYVARGSDDAVFTVPTFRTNALSEELLDLRDRRVLAFDRQAVRRIDASWPGGSVVIARDGEQWRLVEPFETPGDAERIDALLSDLTYLRADGFVDERLDDADAGLDPPDFTVALELDPEVDGVEKRSIRFDLGRARGDGRRLARGSHPTLYALDNERIDEFPRELVEYRDRQLVRFVSSEADVLEFVFTHETEQGGASVRAAVRRDGVTWASEPPLRAGVGADIVATLANLKADEVVAESVGDDERATLGLAPPRTRIRVLGRAAASDEVPPLLGEVLLGDFDADRGILAMRPGRDEVFRLAARVAENLPTDHAAYESRFIAPAPEPETEPAATGSADGSDAETTE